MDKKDSEHSVQYRPPEKPGWRCDVFKDDYSMIIRLKKGLEPNWFHRKMQELIFGVKWEKTND